MTFSLAIVSMNFLRCLQSIPSGPSISTVDRPESGDERPFFGTTGGIIVKFTSGGIERGARPIWDRRLLDIEKDREATAGNAGRRNAGIEADVLNKTAFPRHFD